MTCEIHGQLNQCSTLKHRAKKNQMKNNEQKKKELLLFEWVVVDNCNLFCDYCVNKGAYSHKRTPDVLYASGRELEIAHKICELSCLADKVIVTLTGGEPLLARHFKEVLEILKESGNIYINLITNLKLLDKYADVLAAMPPHISVGGSLHVHYRSDNEIDGLIASLNKFQGVFPLTLSQVDYELTSDDIEKISRIKYETGLDVNFQTYIPPWTEAGRIVNEDKILNKHFVGSKGKRCCLGYSHFFILADATFYYDLWCKDGSRKIGNFLEISKETLDRFILKDMKKCPAASCGCNYNTFSYQEYLQACDRHGYPDNEVFGRYNIRVWQRILRWFTHSRAA